MIRALHILRTSIGAEFAPVDTTQVKTKPMVTTGQSPTGRLYALDLARFVAMCFMMQGHVLDAMVQGSAIDTTIFPWNVWQFVRGLTAPVFLMVSGAVHAFATKRNADGSVREDVIAKRIRMAITIIGIGYLMVFPANRVWDLPFVPAQNWMNFYAVNILQLTGAALILFVFSMATTTNVKQMGKRAAIVLAAILALAPVFQFTQLASAFPDWFSSYLTSDSGSLFPMFPFAGYLFAGLMVGVWLKGLPEEQRDTKLKRYGWRVGLAVASLAVLTQLTLESLGVANSVLESPMSTILFFRRAGIVLMIFSLAVLVLQRTWNMREWYSLFGTKSLYIYIIHLVLLFGTPWWNGPGRWGFRQFTLAEGAMFAVGIITTTLFVAWILNWLASNSRVTILRTSINYGLAVGLFYLLLV
ncbi:MAG: acyltransferase [Ignavibacteria bacterium]|nr:acyltransferase [Ignavibacteria bacterium]